MRVRPRCRATKEVSSPLTPATMTPSVISRRAEMRWSTADLMLSIAPERVMHLRDGRLLPNVLVQLQAQYHHCGEAASEKCLSAATFVRLHANRSRGSRPCSRKIP